MRKRLELACARSPGRHVNLHIGCVAGRVSSPDTGHVAHAVALAGPQTMLHQPTATSFWEGHKHDRRSQVQRGGRTEHVR